MILGHFSQYSPPSARQRAARSMRPWGLANDFVMARKPSRELIVTLQSFDRLKQEFEALGDALGRYAEATNSAPMSTAARSQLEQDIIEGITVADPQGPSVEPPAGRSACVVGAARYRPSRSGGEVGVDVVY